MWLCDLGLPVLFYSYRTFASAFLATPTPEAGSVLSPRILHLQMIFHYIQVQIELLARHKHNLGRFELNLIHTVGFHQT